MDELVNPQKDRIFRRGVERGNHLSTYNFREEVDGKRSTSPFLHPKVPCKQDDKAKASLSGLAVVSNGPFHKKVQEVHRPRDLLKYKQDLMKFDDSRNESLRAQTQIDKCKTSFEGFDRASYENPKWRSI